MVLKIGMVKEPKKELVSDFLLGQFRVRFLKQCLSHYECLAKT